LLYGKPLMKSVHSLQVIAHILKSLATNN